jgi:lipooligosaccharide transport system ATP-binding protein
MATRAWSMACLSAIAPGECLGVIGPNGAGKTTTIRMCLGLTAPDSGQIRYFARADGAALEMPRDALAIKARLGVVTQFDSLDPDFSCAENLFVFGRYFGLRRAQMAERVPQLLDFAALGHKADAKPAELSGGMKRRCRWRVRWSTTPTCCCWTNPPPASTRKRAT